MAPPYRCELGPDVVAGAKASSRAPDRRFFPKFISDGHRELIRSGWTVSADRSIDELDTRELVQHCIAQLPESYRTILLLRDIEEYSTEETCRLLGLTEPNAKTRLHRARQALREMLDVQFESRRSKK
jgi:RNA polymerase sigma-70 factor (ECF subfamily)